MPMNRVHRLLLNAYLQQLYHLLVTVLVGLKDKLRELSPAWDTVLELLDRETMRSDTVEHKVSKEGGINHRKRL